MACRFVQKEVSDMMTRRHNGVLPATVFILLTLLLAACGGTSGTTSAVPPAASGDYGAPATTAPAGATNPGDYGYGSDYGAGGTGTPVTTPGTTSSATTTSVPAAPGDNPHAQRFAVVPDKSKATYTAKQRVFVPGLGETVVGSTGAVTGDIFIDQQRPSDSRIGTITVNIEQLATDSGQRDSTLRGKFLESSKFPTATFTATRLAGLPDTPYADGQELTFTITGDLTIRSVTRETTFAARGKVVGDTLTGTATTTIAMTDFGVEPPNIANFVSVENNVQLALTIEAQRMP
jgi:polyisoprenoid-binding protein YceI